MTEELLASCMCALQWIQASPHEVCAIRTPADRSGSFFVPGRIEVLGKHTDYAGGRSLLCTVERGIVLHVTPRSDRRVRVVDALSREIREMDLDPDIVIERGDWSTYVATVVARVARLFPHPLRGADIAFASDLPQASGMSSSSALVVAIFLALDCVNDITTDPRYVKALGSPAKLAAWLSTVESGQRIGGMETLQGVGVFGGSEDHTAILCCRPDLISGYSFCPIKPEHEIALGRDYMFAIAFSGVAAPKTQSARDRYNELSNGVRTILDLFNATSSAPQVCLADAIATTPDAAQHIRALIRASSNPDFTVSRLMDRFDHFMMESYTLIPRATEALQRRDYTAFGTIVDESQRGAEQLLRNQVPETIALARRAREHGAVAASAFGAGFGGSVWALVPANGAAEFASAWEASYRQEFPAAAVDSTFFLTRPGNAAMRLQ